MTKTVENHSKNPTANELLRAAREAAWSGNHVKAIALASQALAPIGKGSQNTVPILMELYDARAESYIATGKLDLAAFDANAMLELAKKGKQARLEAQALNRQALVQMRQGELQTAVITASAGLQAAHKSKQKPIIAESLYRLAEAQYRIRATDKAIDTARQAAELYEVLGNASGQGRALWVLALCLSSLGQAEESHRIAGTALALCRKAGDQYGIGNILNVLSFTEPDLAKNLELLRQARQAFESAGYLDRQATIQSNLANLYSGLGLFRRARRLYQEAIRANRQMGTRLGLAVNLDNLAESEIELGEFDSVRELLAAEQELLLTLGDPGRLGFHETNRGLLAIKEKLPQTAISHLVQALEFSQTAMHPGSQINDLTLLGRALLANGDPAAALEATTRATDLHRVQGFARLDSMSRQETWWRHSQALMANGRTEEAQGALEKAYNFMVESIAHLTDEGLRRNFLNKYGYHREIIAAWLTANRRGSSRTAPPPPHLAIESNLREPFRRLTDSGLRLNALRSVPEIQTFLVEEATELTGGERVLLIPEQDGKRQVAEALVPFGEEADKVLSHIDAYLNLARHTRTVQLVYTPAKASPLKQRSRIIAPLIAQNNLSGYLYADMDGVYGRFTETDSDMLGMLANQGAVALDNAQWAQGLEQKVEERTIELNARMDELAILNSVGEAMARTLDVKTVAKIVGDKVRSIFDSESVTIRLYDPTTNQIQRAYDYDLVYEDLTDSSFPKGKGLTSLILDSGEPLLFGTRAEADAAGAFNAPGQNKGIITESYMGVPIIAGNQVIGTVSVQSYKQHAYKENDVRLLQTLAANMGVAIQNARLFEAEQQRVAELAIINSVQAGLASKLDMQSIYDLIGYKIREIFGADVVGIRYYDRTTNLLYYPFLVDHGERYNTEPAAPVGFAAHILETRRPIVILTEEELQRRMAELGSRNLGSETVDKSFLFVPILQGDQVTGVISVGKQAEHAFSNADLNLLTTLANSMSVALENARLFDETQSLFNAEQERVAELQIINSIQQGLAAELNFQAIVDLVGDKLREVFHTGDFGIRWYDEKSNLVHYLYEYEHGKRLDIPPAPPNPGGTFDLFLKNRTPIVANTAELSSRTGGTVIAGTDMSKSMISVPIVTGDRLTGSLQIENYERENAFGESELRLLTTIAASLGTALENARLFDETQRLLKETEQRAAELAIINSVQAGLASKLDIQAIYDLVGDKIREIFNADTTYIISYAEATRGVFSHYYVERDRRLAPQSLEFGQGLYSQVIDTRQPVLFGTNSEQHESSFGVVDIPSPDSSEDLNESFLGVPILLGNQVTGVVSIQSYKQNAYSETDVRLLQTLANSMSVALENARLFDETQRLLKITKERAAELAIINSVQQGLASKLDFTSIIDLVGDKVREIFSSDDMSIALYDSETDLTAMPYFYESGKRFPIETKKLGKGFTAHVIHTRTPLMINQDEARIHRELGGDVIGDDSANQDLDEQSYLGVPILKGDRALGVIALYAHKTHAFTDAHLNLLVTMTSAMSVALENARLFDETQRLLKITEDRAAELAIINSVQEGLSSKLEFQAIIDLVGDKLGEVFNSPDLNIRLYDPASNLVQVPYLREHGERIHLAPMPLAGLAKHVIESRQVLVINQDMDRRSAEIDAPVLPGTDNEKSLVAVPILTGNQVLGLVNISNFERENAYSESDVRLLTTIASSMGVALENARLFDETQRLLKLTEERNAELAIINSVQEGLASKLDYRAIIDLVGDKILDIFQVQMVGIMTYDPATDMLTDRYAFEKGDRTLVAGLIPAFGFRKHVIKTRQPLLINRDVERLSVEYDNPILYGGVAKAVVFVPMLVGNQVTGVITLQNMDHEDVFTETDVRLLQTLANAMSVALENARLLDETQRLLKITEDRAAELAIINSVQEGLASKMEMQSIYDLVGDKIREIFDAPTLYIAIFDTTTGTDAIPYSFEDGERFYSSSLPLTNFERRMIESPQSIMINNSDLNRWKELGMKVIPGTEVPKSGMWVPLISANTVRGMISIQNTRREHAYSDSDLRLLQTLANSMSAALENARLLDETTRRANEMTALTDTGREISASLDLNTVLDRVTQNAQKVLHAATSAVYLMEPDGKTLRAISATGAAAEAVKEFRPRLGQGLIGSITANGVAEAIADTITDPRTIHLPGTNPTASGEKLMVAPLFSANKVSGAISVWRDPEDATFTAEDVTFLDGMARQAGIAIQNARLFDESQRLLKETDQRAAELAIINSVQQGLASQLNYEGIVELVGNKIHEIFAAATMMISIYDAPANRMDHFYLLERGERFPSISETPPDALRAEIIQKRRSLVINTDFAARCAALGMTDTIAGEAPKSWLGVPITRGDQVVGVISLQDLDREHAFDKAVVRLLETVASSMSVALENARLFNETNQRAAELAIINSVQQGLASQLNERDIIELVGEKVHEISSAEALMISTYDAGENRIDHAYMLERGVRFPSTSETPPDANRGEIIRTRQTLLINENYAERCRALGIRIAIAGEAPKSWLGVPILRGDQVLGIISLQNLERENAFDRAEVRLLETVASSMSVALENARLFDETTRRANEMTALTEIGREISATLDLNAVLEQIATRAQGVLNARDVSIRLLEPDGSLPTAVAVGKYAAINKQDTLKIGEGITGHIVQSGIAEIVNDPDNDPRAIDLPGTEEDEPNEVMLFAPLVLRGQVTGVMVLWRDRATSGPFVQTDLDFIVGLSRQAAIAIQNARLFDESLRLLEEAKLARESAEAANRTKSTFLANMSHELRTPLNAIIGYSEMLMEEAQDSGQESMTPDLAKINVAGKHLLDLINAILDLSKIEAGKMDLYLESFGVNKMVNEVVSVIQPLVAKNNNTLQLQLAENLGTMRADLTKVRQSLFNLLSNAFKFTEHGTVTLEVQRTDTEPGYIMFQVRDTGIGMTNEQSEKLFQEFTQADASTSRRYGGTGLGLALSRRFCRMMGGDITVTSEQGVGSTFTITLPTEVIDPKSISAEADTEALAPIPADAKKVVVIDDEPTARDLLQRVMRSEGFHVLTAAGGEEGLRLIKAIHPDVITLDVMMPGMDGWAVLTRLKADAETADIPVIMLTILDDKNLGYTLGAADYVTKPIDRERLVAILERYRGAHASHSVLVVEDEAATREMLRRMLEKEEWNVVEAENGRQALERLGQAVPQLILLDLMMPEMDGFEFVAEMRKHPDWSAVPVVVVTAKDLTPEDRLRLNGHVDRILQKGAYTREELLAQVRERVKAVTAATK